MRHTLPPDQRTIVFGRPTLERRAGGGGITKIIGYAAVFAPEVSQDLGGFREKIDAGAFRQTLASSPDVRALFNHDSSLILGRTRSGTLRLATDAEGLRYEVDLPDTSYADDLAVSLDRGDVDQSSFGFRVVRDRWDYVNGEDIRTLLEVNLDGGDVSVVTYPATLATSAAVRAAGIGAAPGHTSRFSRASDPLAWYWTKQRQAEAT